MHCTIDCSPGDPAWDELVLHCEYPAVEQLCAWGRSRARRGWESFRLELSDEGTLLGGAQVLVKSLLFGIRVGYVHNGFIPAHFSEGAASLLVGGLIGLCRTRRLKYLVVRLASEAGQWVDALKGAGFLIKPAAVPPLVRMRDSVRVDLREDEDALFRSLRSTTRKHVRRAAGARLTVREGTRGDLPVFEALVRELCARRGVVPNVPMGDELGELWDSLDAGRMIRMLFVEAGGTPTCAMIVLHLGTLARAWAIGWDGRHGDSFPNELIYWESIRRARASGCRWFDMGGIGDVAPGAPSDDDGITFFKLGFGGAIVHAPPELFFAPSTLYRAAIRSCREGTLVSRLASWCFQKMD